MDQEQSETISLKEKKEMELHERKMKERNVIVSDVISVFKDNANIFKDLFDLNGDNKIDKKDWKKGLDDGTWILFGGILISMMITSIFDYFMPQGMVGFWGTLSKTSSPFIMLYASRQYLNKYKVKYDEIKKIYSNIEIECNQIKTEFEGYKQRVEIEKKQVELDNARELNLLQVSNAVKQETIDQLRERTN